MTEYHCPESCNKCKGLNEINIKNTINHIMCECETIRTVCEHKDYWAYGFYESSKDMDSNCETYK